MNKNTGQTKYIAFLQSLKRTDDRSSLARLRRSMTSESGFVDGLAVVGARLPDGLPDHEVDTYLLVAGLFATHPVEAADASLGASLRRLRQSLSVGAESLDQRFEALLESGRDDLSFRLRQIVTRLAGTNIGVNYLGLLNDLLYWDADGRRVQRRWARDYWTQNKSTTR